MYFNLISTFVYDVLTELYDLSVVNYLDDFIAVAPSYDECLVAQEKIVRDFWDSMFPSINSFTHLDV